MCIDRGGGIAREVLAAAGNTGSAERVIKRFGVFDYFLRGLPVTTTTQRIVRIVVEGNVEHGTEIEIESERAKEAAGNIAVAANQLEVPLVVQLLRIGRLVPDQTQPRHAAALLINGNNWLDFADITEVIDQLPQLDRRLDVSPEQDESAGLHAPQ